MKRFLHCLVAIALGLLFATPIYSQNLEPFTGCPGVSVAVTRPGLNSSLAPSNIYLVDEATGAMQPVGNPIPLQINAFGLNNDGFLYGMQASSNVANPFLTRVDKNGAFQNLGTILPPAAGAFKMGIINTAAGTTDDENNYFFTAVVIDLQNTMLPPDLYVGKISNLSALTAGSNPLTITYKKVGLGTCAADLLALLQNPMNGVFQDIAFNPVNRNIYTYLPGPGATPSSGKMAWFNPNATDPSLNCISPAQPNTSTSDLAGLFFGKDAGLYILTTDGKFFRGDINTGAINPGIQTTLPLQSNNLRGDMASCTGNKVPVPFKECPGLSLVISRPGINSTLLPHQVYQINAANGDIQPIGHPINLQINAFGLNSKDGFLYGMHESFSVFGPFLSRVDANGDFVDLGKLTPPSANDNRVGIINTAAATMDGEDNYYFTAILADTQQVLQLPNLYLGVIRNVSKIKAGDQIVISYSRILLGNCLDEILLALASNSGLIQDIAYNPKDGRIYTYIQPGASPKSGKLAWFSPNRRFSSRPPWFNSLHCITPQNANPATQDLAGMFADKNGKLYILTIDGKFYQGHPNNGTINLITQTGLPLLSNNLRGDMASCVDKHKKDEDHHDGDHDEDDDKDKDHNRIGEDKLIISEQPDLKIAPNPVNVDQVVVYVDAVEAGSATLRILNENGNTVQTGKLTLTKGENQYRLNVPGLRKGMYALVLVSSSGKTQTVKFIRL